VVGAVAIWRFLTVTVPGPPAGWAGVGSDYGGGHCQNRRRVGLVGHCLGVSR
jgi:hypothetical protein